MPFRDNVTFEFRQSPETDTTLTTIDVSFDETQIESPFDVEFTVSSLMPATFTTPQMPRLNEPVDVWVFNHLTEQFSDERVGEMAADGLRLSFVEHYSSAVRERISETDNYDDAVREFNSVTSEWPVRIRALLAGYETAAHNYENDEFNDNLADFARAEGMMEPLDDASSPSDGYPDNPYSSDSLSREQARTLLLLRAYGVEQPSAIERAMQEVDDYQTFREWFADTEDVETAIEGHEYDNDLPGEVMGVADSPDDWPSQMSARDVHSPCCTRCDATVYRVSIDGESQWVNHNGRSTEIANVDTPSSPFVRYEAGRPSHSTGEHDIMCAACAGQWANGTDIVAVYNGDDLHRIEYNDHLYADFGMVGNSAYTPLGELSSNMQDDVLTAARGGHPNGWVTLTIHDGPGAPTRKERALSGLANGNPVFDLAGPVIIHESQGFSGTDRELLFPRDNWDAAREAKELLESVGEEQSLVEEIEADANEPEMPINV